MVLQTIMCVDSVRASILRLFSFFLSKEPYTLCIYNVVCLRCFLRGNLSRLFSQVKGDTKQRGTIGLVNNSSFSMYGLVFCFVFNVICKSWAHRLECCHYFVSGSLCLTSSARHKCLLCQDPVFVCASVLFTGKRWTTKAVPWAPQIERKEILLLHKYWWNNHTRPAHGNISSFFAFSGQLASLLDVLF